MIIFILIKNATAQLQYTLLHTTIHHVVCVRVYMIVTVQMGVAGSSGATVDVNLDRR